MNISFLILIQDCVEKKIWFIVRHGTRGFTKKNSGKMQKSLEKVRASIINSYEKGQTKLSNDTINLLKEWKLPTFGIESLQYPEGDRELRGLAQRMKSRFPSLLSLPYSKQAYKVKL